LKDVTVDMEDLKKQFYDAMGFDYHTGAIKKERIAELDWKTSCHRKSGIL